MVEFTRFSTKKNLNWIAVASRRPHRLSAALLTNAFMTCLCLLPQDLLNQQQSCKRCLSVIERNYHTLQRALSTSKVFRNFDLFLLQKRVAEIQSSAQVCAEGTVHKHTEGATTLATTLIIIIRHKTSGDADHN